MSSILISLTVVQFIMAAILTTFWLARIKTGGLKEMALAMTVGGVGALAVGAGAAMMDFRPAGFGLMCFVVAILSATRAMGRLQNRRPRYVLELAALIISAAGIYYFIVVKQNVAGGLVVNSVIFAIVCGLTARDLFGERDPSLRTACRILGAMFAVFAALQLFRIFVRPLFDGPVGPNDQIVTLDVAFAFIGMATVIGWSLGLLWASCNRAEYQLRAAYEELERFSGAVAHDLKSPLNAVIGNLEAAILPSSAMSDQQRAAFLASAHKAALRMNRFIGDLLDDARSAQQASSAETADPGQCLREAQDSLRPMIDAVAAEITVGDLPPVAVTPLQLTRVFQNLLDNALKYRSLERPLTIDISARRQGDTVQIYIKDNGAGISQADQPRVFNRFERGGKQSLVPGDGVGLSECRRIVEKAGGSIDLSSQLGTGSTFRLILPAVS
ncbi:HAMP domain-containing sensor histidine kinase [Thalassospiraceae bacterium LMO-SO8]|nr:HAMP domain-containing histidine kinase [Alphaproteobacteria bacterium LMO-S08]WND77764.1 HAMP domain-containing sensor histidine kinase [Thalassospiraceae bacterium LMO-SO8]